VLPLTNHILDTKEADNTVEETLSRRVKTLASAVVSADGWRNVVEGRDPDNLCSESDVKSVQQHCMLLCQAYIIAIKRLGRGAGKVTWKMCCEEACSILNPLGVVQATNPTSIERYNLTFRSDETFPNPNQFASLGKKPEPQMFQVYPELKERIERYCTANVATLSIESLYNFVHKTLMLATQALFVADLPIDAPQECRTMDHFYYCFNFKNLSFTTVWRWMRHIGFTYDRRKKSFYVDGHERSDVLSKRKTFCWTYLQELEPKCKRWMRIMRSLKEALGDALSDRPCFEFIHDGIQMCEYHTDDVEDIEEVSLNFPLTTSVRVAPNTRPLIILGQDECVFSQHLFGQKQWVTPTGQWPIMPKTEGDIYMLSTLQCRDFGFGRPLTEDELSRVNDSRCQGPQSDYIDVDAAKSINKTAKKPLLLESPFVKYIHVGINNDGCWNSMHMSLQLEDVADCMKVLYSNFDVVVLFDHSAGHDQKREGALDAKNLSRNFGGAQPKMRCSVIKAFNGYLGTHNPKFRVGNTQVFQFTANDAGPFYMTAQERLERRHDRATGVTKREKKRINQLLAELKDKGVPCERGLSHSFEELQTFARNNVIELERDVQKVEEGWIGKPKGMLQTLWERGLIDETNLNSHTNDGRKDANGTLLHATSLRWLLGSCTDFITEETALQYLGRRLGLRILHTPKFHAEMAGEGIEYSWACAKGDYRRQPLHLKKGLRNFKSLVRGCTNQDVLTPQRVCKFSRRARAYICTYYLLALKEDQQRQQVAAEPDEAPNSTYQQALFQDIERLQKKFKTHRCALDFASGFVNAVVKGHSN